jgi:ABC-type molybdenum transport system ATPase subunit/photorepair protein PhrA
MLKVLDSIQWTIRAGDRWHLQGENGRQLISPLFLCPILTINDLFTYYTGSGKTTLLSLLTGDHPQSYTQIPPHSHLHLFGQPRSRIATPRLRSLIGLVSPELFNAFPRRTGMTVWEAVGTGFDGGFVPCGDRGVGIGLDGQLSADEVRWRVHRVWDVLVGLGPGAWSSAAGGVERAEARGMAEAFGSRAFVDLSAGEQSMVLLMRALVGKPQLVLLDEAWSGMDDAMVRAARAYLRANVGSDQAIIVITHWEDEVPWGKEDGVRRFFLADGRGSEV